MKTLESILFPVEKVSLSTLTGLKAVKENEYGIVATIKNEKHLLSVCSSRYNLVPNNQIYLPIETELKNRGVNYNSNYQVIDNSKFYGTYTLNDYSIEISQGDIVKPVIKVFHSYNGTLNYTLAFGYFRLICSNGLVVPVKGQEKSNFHLKGKHTPKLNENLDFFFEKLDYFLTQKELVFNGYNKLLTTKIDNLDEVLIAQMESIKLSAINKRSENKTENFNFAYQQIIKEQNELNTDLNLWLVYNGINATIFNDELNSKHNEFRLQEDMQLMENLLELV